MKYARLKNWLHGLTFSSDLLLAPLMHCYPHQSAVSIATLTYKQTHSMLCGMSIIALLVLHLQHQDCSPPGSVFALLCCCSHLRLVWCWLVDAPPLLVGSSGVQSGSSWTSAVASPQALSLGLDLWVFCVAPTVCMGPPDASSLLDGGCCSPWCWWRCWRWCDCSLCADWQALHLFFALFVLIYVYSTLSSVLGYPERCYINEIYYYYYYYYYYHL